MLEKDLTGLLCKGVSNGRLLSLFMEHDLALFERALFDMGGCPFTIGMEICGYVALCS